MTLLTIACQDKDGDSGNDTASQIEDSATDTAVDSGEPADPDPIEAGSFDVNIISNAGDETGITLRIFHPRDSNLGYGDRAPIVLVVPGGWSAGHLSPAGVDRQADNHGYIYVEMLLPGGLLLV